MIIELHDDADGRTLIDVTLWDCMARQTVYVEMGYIYIFNVKGPVEIQERE